jgi:hypothetical protein
MTSTRGLAVIGVLAAVLAAGVGPTMAFQAELQRYYDSMRDICRTGVTSQMTAAWMQAVRAMDAARYGGGRDGNFAGIKSPTDTWLDCFQSPGDGKE